MKRQTWKSRATALYRKVVDAGLWSNELADRNYSGAGGVVHPDGKFLSGIDANDVGFEQLYFDCLETLKEANIPV